MSKYIPQINETNFVYPNFEISEYDVDIIHNINNNSVSGVVTTFSATTVNSTGITFGGQSYWYRNDADIFLNYRNYLEVVSVHMMSPTQSYYKPWRAVYHFETNLINLTTIGINTTFTVTPSQLGLTSFTSGTYNFEFRFIGLKSIYPVCTTLNITIP